MRWRDNINSYVQDRENLDNIEQEQLYEGKKWWKHFISREEAIEGRPAPIRDRWEDTYWPLNRCWCWLRHYGRRRYCRWSTRLWRRCWWSATCWCPIIRLLHALNKKCVVIILITTHKIKEIPNYMLSFYHKCI